MYAIESACRAFPGWLQCHFGVVFIVADAWWV